MFLLTLLRFSLLDFFFPKPNGSAFDEIVPEVV
jgi:hypothetical protein